MEPRWKREEPTLALIRLGTSFSAGLAHAFGRRNEATLQQLLTFLAPYRFRFYCTDNLNNYAKYLLENQHIATKQFTQGIERQNLSFKIRLKRLARKTICFSISEKLHDTIISEFISREHYQFL